MKFYFSNLFQAINEYYTWENIQDIWHILSILFGRQWLNLLSFIPYLLVEISLKKCKIAHLIG